MVGSRFFDYVPLCPFLPCILHTGQSERTAGCKRRGQQAQRVSAASGLPQWRSMDRYTLFYNSDAWKQKRERALRRDKYQCVECKRYGRRNADGLPVTADLVHHVVPVEVDWSKKLELNNLQSLCRACHNKKHPEKGSPPGRRRGAERSS